MIRIPFFLLIVFSFTETIIGQTFRNEGLVNFISGVQPEGFHNYTWFKDSSIIFESYIEESESIDDSLILRESHIYKYTILDLTNYKAQDYLTFEDTATPVTNYLYYDAKNPKHEPYENYMDSLLVLPDTTIENLRYKRFYFDLFAEKMHQRVTYFLLHSTVENILHFSEKLDRRNPGWKVTRIQYSNMLTGESTINLMIKIRDSLTAQEKLIFQKWTANSRTITLPVTSRAEAGKIFARIKYQIE